jgi:hypothetical protein
MRDRGCGASADPRRCDRIARTLYIAFFSRAAECDDHRVGIAEEASNFGLRREARESVDVLESLEIAHPHIVTGFQC